MKAIWLPRTKTLFLYGNCRHLLRFHDFQNYLHWLWLSLSVKKVSLSFAKMGLYDLFQRYRG